MFCFTNILNIFFSFVTCSISHTKTQEMALKRLYFSKFPWGACPRTPLEVLAPKARVGQIHVPPKFLSPYTYVQVHNCPVIGQERCDIFDNEAFWPKPVKDNYSWWECWPIKTRFTFWFTNLSIYFMHVDRKYSQHKATQMLREGEKYSALVENLPSTNV